MKQLKQILSKIIFLIIILGLIYFIKYVNLDNIDLTNFRKESTPTINLNDKDNFKIYFIDVGQADCILITNNGENALIDAGNNEDGKKLVEYFHSLGITNFKYVIGTHAHEDHIGGMDDIIRNFSIEHFYMPEDKINNMTYTEILKELKNKNIKYETPEIDSTFTMAESKFTVLYIAKDKEDLNETSIVLKLNFKNTSYIFTGDASINVEREILEKNLKSDVLKVGHHGSSYSTSAYFLKAVNPDYAIISVGKNNDYNLPKQVTLDKLDRLNIKTYRTDQDGTIILSSDGQNIYFETIKTDTNK